MYRKF